MLYVFSSNVQLIYALFPTAIAAWWAAHARNALVLTNYTDYNIIYIIHLFFYSFTLIPHIAGAKGTWETSVKIFRSHKDFSSLLSYC